MIRVPTCPICDKELPLDPEVRSRLFPFCSVRCRQIDLYRWMKGTYAIVEPLDPESIARQGIDPEAFDPDAGD